MDENKGKIFESLGDIMSEIEAVTKNKTNSQQNYKYRSIDDVYNMIQPIFGKYRVFLVPNVVEIKEEERQSKAGGTLYYTTLTMEYSFYASDGSFITTKAVGKAMDSGDKGLDKAKSSAMKYLLLQMFLIPTEEDKDIESDSSQTTGKSGGKTTTQDKPATTTKPVIQIKTDPPQDETLDPIFADFKAKIEGMDNVPHLENWKVANKDALAGMKEGKEKEELRKLYDAKLKSLKAEFAKKANMIPGDDPSLIPLGDGEKEYNPPA